MPGRAHPWSSQDIPFTTRYPSVFPYTMLKIGFFVQLTGRFCRFSIQGQEVDMAKGKPQKFSRPQAST